MSKTIDERVVEMRFDNKQFEAGVSGFGFLALAVMIFGQWKPQRIALAALLFGLFRALSGKLRVLTPYGEAQQVGRICMDMCMIDVTDLPQIKSGDEVEIFGAHILCADDAALCDTIPYELLCAVSKRVPRVYRLNGALVDKNLQPLSEKHTV